MKCIQNDEAVSENIGNILFLIVTITMAAVIAASLIDMTSSIQKVRIVGATASHNAGDIIVTYHGGQDYGEVAVLTATAGASSVSKNNPSVGAVLVVSGSFTGTQNNVVVTAKFYDDSEQIILDTYV